MNVTDYLLSRGYKANKLRTGSEGFYANISDRTRLRRCEFNKKPPIIFVNFCDNRLHGAGVSYEVELCGLRSGNWVSLKAYSLPSLKEVKLGIRQVRKIWQAL